MIEHREIIGRAKRAARAAKRATQRAERMRYQIEMDLKPQRLEKLDDFVTRSVCNFRRVSESTKTTPVMMSGLMDRAWSIGELLDKVVSHTTETHVATTPDCPRRFRVIDGGRH